MMETSKDTICRTMMPIEKVSAIFGFTSPRKCRIQTQNQCERGHTQQIGVFYQHPQWHKYNIRILSLRTTSSFPARRGMYNSLIMSITHLKCMSIP